MRLHSDARPPVAEPDPHPGTTKLRATHLPGLDGIRALAVVAVLLYHFDVPWAVGGFLGVDVFFVLSGYLISSGLWAKGSISRIDLRDFWARRIRRLLPAVLLLIVGTTGAMIIWGRDQLLSYVGDVLAAATYTSNWWYVFHERSYFEAAGRPPVLQHLWSLAVEEQFYLVWPLVVALVFAAIPRPRGRRTILVGVSLTLAALSALIMGVGSAVAQMPETGDPSRWYFGTDSHATGLLLGACLAFARSGAGFGRLMPALRPTGARATTAGVVAVLGLLVLFGTVDAYSTSLYRWGFAAIAVITTIIIAVVSRPGPLARVFGWAPLRYLGSRSYGMYLWHWPVAAFTRPQLDVPLEGVQLLVLRCMLTMVLAELSYRLVEEPIRTNGWRRPWAQWPSAVTMFRLPVVFVLVGALLMAVTPSKFGLGSSGSAKGGSSATADKGNGSQDAAKASKLSVAVYGDSVAKGAQPALEKVFGDVNDRAQVAEQLWTLLPQVVKDAQEGKIKADVVIIHTGDNGTVSEGQLDKAVAALSGVKHVILVTPKVPRPWERQAVGAIRKVAPKYPNVRLADWNTYSQGHPEWFVSDGVHLETPGQRAYAEYLASLLNG